MLLLSMCFISLLAFREQQDSIGKTCPRELSSFRKEGRWKANTGKLKVWQKLLVKIRNKSTNVILGRRVTICNPMQVSVTLGIVCTAVDDRCGLNLDAELAAWNWSTITKGTLLYRTWYTLETSTPTQQPMFWLCGKEAKRKLAKELEYVYSFMKFSSENILQKYLLIIPWITLNKYQACLIVMTVRDRNSFN